MNSNRAHNRKSLGGEDAAAPISGYHPSRRRWIRREVTERVILRRLEKGAAEEWLEGWALNLSPGGVRVVTEDVAQLGEAFEVCVGDEEPQVFVHGLVVWLQNEPDGSILGIEFGDLSGTPLVLPPPLGDEPFTDIDSVDGPLPGDDGT